MRRLIWMIQGKTLYHPSTIQCYCRIMAIFMSASAIRDQLAGQIHRDTLEGAGEVQCAIVLPRRYVSAPTSAVARRHCGVCRPPNRSWRIRSATHPANRPGGIWPTTNPANRSRWIRSTANPANQSRRITGAHPANRSRWIWSSSTCHNVLSFCDVTIVRAIPHSFPARTPRRFRAQSGRAPPVVRRNRGRPGADRRPTDSPTR